MVEVPNSYSPGAITPIVAGPSAVVKAIDFTLPSKYSLVLNMVHGFDGQKYKQIPRFLFIFTKYLPILNEMLIQKLTLKVNLLLAAMLLFILPTIAQDTFSIVAIDSITGEIGSAGASCVGSSTSYPHGAQILSDVIPGIGAIHTQAAWNPVNQQNAHDWMMMGLTPQQIIDSLVAHDVNNNPSTRQYGITDYHGGHPRSAGYTGSNCTNYKNHMAHLNYSIQGNILLGQRILDSIRSRFENTPGTLADRLMASLQGAKVVGADTRCAVRHTSSQSSFLRVARIDNTADSLYLDLWMAYPQNYTGVFPVDPIDSLQTLYNIWKTTVSAGKEKEFNPANVTVYNDQAGKTVFDFTRCKDYLGQQLIIFDMTGRSVCEIKVTERVMHVDLTQNASGQILAYRLVRQDRKVVAAGKFLH